MKKILILTEEFRAMTNANGICTKAIVDVLSQNNDVTVLSLLSTSEEHTAEKYNGVNVEYQNNFWWELKDNPKAPTVEREVVKILRKVRNLLMRPFFPINSISPVIRFYFKACRLCERYNFDIVVCFFRPYESFIVGTMLKKKFPALKVIHYMLDTLLNYIPPAKLLTKSFCHKRNLKLEYWGYTHCDAIINLLVQKESYESDSRYDKVRHKLLYADIPLLKTRPKVSDTRIKKGTMVYAGSLVKEYRNPSYALNLFSLLPEKYQALFYCSGDCNDMVDEYSNKYKTISNGGYIKHELLEKKLEEADALINFGNYRLNMIPSKIFEYFSFEKKIIHFYKDDEDTCLLYLKKYPYALLIDERNPLADNLDKIIKFLDNEKPVSTRQAWRKDFYMNTPEYTAKLILEEDKKK
ncbi:hypothetical protein [uncultured Veillonella sp.]|uniref:hypothetical protein n=1 Tax=uncultured Veillonella sp. TaxID=159268 RepID=UPI00259220B9|nr:hypothetical protein [uncultured Veillonella sp.]